MSPCPLLQFKDIRLTELPKDLEEAYDPELAARSIKLTEDQISHLESLADVLEDNMKSEL